MPPMTNNKHKEITDLLSRLLDPQSGKPLQVESADFDGKRVRAVLLSKNPEVIALCKHALAEKLNIAEAQVQIILTQEKENYQKDKPKKLAKNIIAIASGKGGVGKSTIAVNLALASARRGLRCGLLDADIYGPSTPTMLGIDTKPLTENKKLVPIEVAGIKFISLGLLVAEKQALVWRGPMVHSAVSQLLDDVLWGELDILFIDMPPGTGDAQLTLAQKQVLTAAILVSTPQEIALIDVRRALNMFQTMNVPIAGIIENMAWFEDAAGKKNYIFGEGGAKKFAEENDVLFLGQVPLTPELRQAADEGNTIALPIFEEIIQKLKIT